MKTLCQYGKMEAVNEPVGVFRCAFCNIREHIALPVIGESGEPITFQQFSNRWGSILYNSCHKCHRPMVLEKIIDNHQQMIVDVYQWINDEVHRFKTTVGTLK